MAIFNSYVSLPEGMLCGFVGFCLDSWMGKLTWARPKSEMGTSWMPHPIWVGQCRDGQQANGAPGMTNHQKLGRFHSHALGSPPAIAGWFTLW
jgi:hypothetical protein